MRAAVAGNGDVVRLLLEAGADPHVRTRRGETAADLVFAKLAWHKAHIKPWRGRERRAELRAMLKLLADAQA
jgi:hypothetical protein